MKLLNNYNFKSDETADNLFFDYYLRPDFKLKKMANEDKSITVTLKSDNVITTFMHRMMLEIRNISKLPQETIIQSPDFYLVSNFLVNILFKKDSKYSYLFIYNKSDTDFEIERTLIILDVYNKRIHEESDKKVFFLKKNEKVDAISKSFSGNINDAFPNDSLLIDLSICVKENATEKKKCDIELVKKLRKDLKTMLENPVNSDVTLYVGNESIPAHWSILCSRSQYFKKMFESNMKESVQNSITITDLTLSTTKKFLEFLYTANFDDKEDLQELFDIYYAADKYEVTDLKVLCAREIMNKATVENACQVLQFAHRHSDDVFKMEALGFIHLNLEAVFKTEGWKTFKDSEPLAADVFRFILNKR